MPKEQSVGFRILALTAICGELPYDHRGERLLALLCNRELCTRLEDILLDDLYEGDKNSTLENDAFYISKRSGEISVHVESKAKQLGTWRISNYTSEYRETTGVGKRKLLTMDEVLRLSIHKALIIIRGWKLLMVDKCDYTRHPGSKRLSPSKASAHIPQWQKTKPPEPVETPIVELKPQRKKRTASTVMPADKDSILS